MRLRSASNGFTCTPRALRARSSSPIGCRARRPPRGARARSGSPVPVRPSSPSSASQQAAAASSSARWSGAPELAHRHHAGGQRAGLVGADDRRAAQRLDRRQPADEHVARRHALHADGQRDRDDRRQPLGHGGDRERHRRHEHLQRRPAAQQTRAPRRRRRSPRQRSSSVRLTRARRVCSGVVVSAWRWRAGARSCPSSVAMPVATTSARAVPVATDVPMKTRVEALGQRRVRGHAASVASRPARSRRSAPPRSSTARAPRAGARRRRRRRPPRARSRSPGTTVAGGDLDARGRRGRRARAAPSSIAAPAARSRRGTPGRSRPARSARRSSRWRRRRRPRRGTPTTTAAPSSSQMSGLANCRASSRQRDVRCARWISLAPTSARRRRRFLGREAGRL